MHGAVTLSLSDSHHFNRVPLRDLVGPNFANFTTPQADFSGPDPTLPHCPLHYHPFVAHPQPSTMVLPSEFIEQFSKSRTEAKEEWQKKIDRAIDQVYDFVLSEIAIGPQPLPSFPEIFRRIETLLKFKLSQEFGNLVAFSESGNENSLPSQSTATEKTVSGSNTAPGVSLHQISPFSRAPIHRKFQDKNYSQQTTKCSTSEPKVPQKPERDRPLSPPSFQEQRSFDAGASQSGSNFHSQPSFQGLANLKFASTHSLTTTIEPAGVHSQFLPSTTQPSFGQPSQFQKTRSMPIDLQQQHLPTQRNNPIWDMIGNQITNKMIVDCKMIGKRLAQDYDQLSNPKRHQTDGLNRYSASDHNGSFNNNQHEMRQQQAHCSRNGTASANTSQQSNMSVAKRNVEYHNKVINPQKDFDDYLASGSSQSSSPELLIDRYTVLDFTCPECPRCFADKRSLNNHLLTVHEIYLHRCPLTGCVSSFDTREQLDTHFKMVHKSPQWKCYACSFEGGDVEELTDHLDFEHQEGRFKCTREGCEFISATPSAAYDHYGTDHSNGSQGPSLAIAGPSASLCLVATTANSGNSQREAKYKVIAIKCLLENCYNYFADDEELNGHLRLQHQVAPYACPIIGCTKSYDQVENLEIHARNMHAHLLDSLACPQCGQTADTFHNLRTHIMLYHHEGQFSCAFPSCTKLAKFRGLIVEHYQKNHE